VLALLGDIGLPNNPMFENFLLNLTTKFELVLFIPGNHEYYQHEALLKKQIPHSYREIEEKMKEICAKSPKLVYMNKHAIKVGGVRIIGASLWSYVPAYALVEVASALNDYQNIFNDAYEPITPTLTNEWFNQDLSFIVSQLDNSIKNEEENCLVITHHTPSMTGTSEPQYEGPLANKVNHAFSTSLEYLFRDFGRFDNSNIHTWCFGHTHFNCNSLRYGTKLIANQRGYRSAKTQYQYNPSFVIHVPIKKQSDQTQTNL